MFHIRVFKTRAILNLLSWKPIQLGKLTLSIIECDQAKLGLILKTEEDA